MITICNVVNNVCALDMFAWDHGLDGLSETLQQGLQLCRTRQHTFEPHIHSLESPRMREVVNGAECTIL
jgi:hypothetical protein